MFYSVFIIKGPNVHMRFFRYDLLPFQYVIPKSVSTAEHVSSTLQNPMIETGLANALVATLVTSVRTRTSVYPILNSGVSMVPVLMSQDRTSHASVIMVMKEFAVQTITHVFPILAKGRGTFVNTSGTINSGVNVIQLDSMVSIAKSTIIVLIIHAIKDSVNI